jgi:toxin YoeB
VRNTVFTPESLEHLTEWATYEQKVLKRIFRILDEYCRTPFEGLGKPERLEGNLRGCWSRRVDEEHRPIYEVSDAEIIVLSLRGHYD